MNTVNATLFKHYLEHVFAGKRCEARELVFGALDRGIGARKLLRNLIWPAMEQIEKLYREDHIMRIVEHMATRINRMIADQLHAFLAREPKTGQRMVVLSGAGQQSELGAQIMADLFEADGWTVYLLGSGVPNDEVLPFVGKVKADVLSIYGMHAEGTPSIRNLIALIREVGTCEDMQVMVVGGVFNRAQGLADEVKADLCGKNIAEAIKTVLEHPVRIPKPDVPEPGRRRKRRKQRPAAKQTHKMRKTKTAQKAKV